MRCSWLSAMLLVLVIAGCAPVTAGQLRDKPGGVHSFSVAADYQAVYQKVLSHAQACSRKGAFGDNAVVQGSPAVDSNRASISITDSRAVGVTVLFIIDVARSDDTTTAVKVYYSANRYKGTALLIEEWIRNNAPDCTRGKFVPECAC